MTAVPATALKSSSAGLPPLRLWIAPGTSGLAPHVALAATGAAFEIRPVDLTQGEHRQAAILHVNPFGTVLALEDGGQVIPETGAILLHLAERFPAAGLLAPGGAARSQGLRWLFHAAAVHADFMTWRRSMFRYSDDAEGKASVQAWMADRLAAAFPRHRRGDGRALPGGRCRGCG